MFVNLVIEMHLRKCQTSTVAIKCAFFPVVFLHSGMQIRHIRIFLNWRGFFSLYTSIFIKKSKPKQTQNRTLHLFGENIKFLLQWSHNN